MMRTPSSRSQPPHDQCLSRVFIRGAKVENRAPRVSIPQYREVHGEAGAQRYSGFARMTVRKSLPNLHFPRNVLRPLNLEGPTGG